MSKKPKPYPSDVSDEEWEFCAPYLTLMKEQALRRLERACASWRLMPREFPPWWVVQQQTQRWLRAGCFEAMAHELRAILRMVQDRNPEPTAVIMDSRTMQSTPESDGRAGFDGHKKRKGSKVHAAVDTLGHLLALKVTPANEQDRAQVGELAKAVQAVTGANVKIAYVDQGYTGVQPAADAAGHGLRLEVVKHQEAKRGFVLLPRRWVVERSFGWAARLRRLARDYERLATTMAGYHWVAFAFLMLQSLFH
jgi:transposase